MDPDIGVERESRLGLGISCVFPELFGENDGGNFSLRLYPHNCLIAVVVGLSDFCCILRKVRLLEKKSEMGKR